ncbi:MAG: hypothetical protein R6X25_07020 [Candidatus Krumholzibacteriia bacterium]
MFQNIEAATLAGSAARAADASPDNLSDSAIYDVSEGSVIAMGDLKMSVGLAIVLTGFPLAAWLGAILTREGRPLARVVERHFRFLVIGLFVFNLCLSLLADEQNVPAARILELTVFYLLVMLFVPMLRRLQHKTEQSLSTNKPRR